MPRVSFSPENKSDNPFDFPKLSLDRGESARILLIEPEPLGEYTHTLRAPQLLNGVLQTETVRGRDGQDREVPKMDFIGRHLCLGDHEVIAKKGVDVDRCPECRASQESDAIPKPERRFALHVMKIETKPGGFTPVEPFACKTIVWAFGDRVFNIITEAVHEWGDMKQHDLLLGPCENKQYQKFEIKVARQAAWLEDAERDENGKIVQLGDAGNLVKATYENNQAADLKAFIGRKVSADMMLDDVDSVLRRTRQAMGEPAPEPSEADKAQAAEGLADLLGDEAPAKPEPEAEAPPSEDVQELASEEAVEEAKVEKPEGDKLDFDDLLSM